MQKMLYMVEMAMSLMVFESEWSSHAILLVEVNMVVAVGEVEEDLQDELTDLKVIS